ncbi:hypothetical protein Dsin_001150 [Dipteronia sinensis]|uniref:Uncharacterized protein n=1 Tax=Dipteronia sinensis TaxID=43782 RepID=A0AAE0EIG6_9ROSI|nr:hypothetical protein Dsin_001150 [Dipteronia sinensis]
MSTEENTGTPTLSVIDKGCKKRKEKGQNKNDYNKIAKAKESGIPINDLGQPHGESSKLLSTSCGLIVSQLIPITYDSWPKVPEIMKNSVWETIKEISRKYGELAKKNQTPHTTSRKGFARLREELES